MSIYKNVHTLDNDGCEVPEAVPSQLKPSGERSINDVFSYISELFSRLTSDLGELFNLHTELFKAEMRDAGKAIARDSALLIAAAAIGWFAFAGFTLALIALVSWLLPIDEAHLSLAAGAAIVGVLYAILAGVLAMMGIKHLQKSSLAPDRTIQEIKRDKEAVKELK